jgi:hypothetical protein
MSRIADARFWRVLAVAATMWSCTGTTGQEQPSVLTGPRFKAELDKPISIARDSIAHEGAELRPLLQRIASERGVALVLDRRVDPSRRIDLDLPPFRLHDALAKIAAEADCLRIVAGDTVFIGPHAGSGKLPTLIALRESELDQPATQPGGRELELRRAWTFAWDDLDRPADLVLIAAQHWALEVEGLDQVPHDLWAGGALAGVNAVEALSVLLVQFDLTFEWTADRTGVRIVPIPDKVVITRAHAVRRVTPARALERVRELYPELDVQVQGRELVATGTAEEHEVVARLARGESPDEPAPKPVDFGPLNRRRFTIQVVSRPVETVLRTLVGNGIDVRYDADQFKTMGIDLSKQISFDLKEATVEELFAAICEPAGLQFVVQGELVTLSAK